MDNVAVLEAVDDSGTKLAVIWLPFDKLGELFLPHLSIFTELRLDGSLTLAAEFFALAAPTETDLLELIKRAIAPEMLEDEPNAKERLAILQQRLTEALALVDQTLSNLDKSVP